MIGIVAAMGGEIERDRQAFLAGGEVAAVERVGIFSGGEAGVLPDRPGLVDIHGWIRAAQIGRNAGEGLEEVEALEVGFGIGRLHRNAFGRQPRLRTGASRRQRRVGEGDGGEVRDLVISFGFELLVPPD